MLPDDTSGRVSLDDLRRSAVRNLIRAGISEQVAMTLGSYDARDLRPLPHHLGSDQTEAVRRLPALQEYAPEQRKVVAMGGARRGSARALAAK